MGRSSTQTTDCRCTHPIYACASAVLFDAMGLDRAYVCIHDLSVSNALPRLAFGTDSASRRHRLLVAGTTRWTGALLCDCDRRHRGGRRARPRNADYSELVQHVRKEGKNGACGIVPCWCWAIWFDLRESHRPAA